MARSSTLEYGIGFIALNLINNSSSRFMNDLNTLSDLELFDLFKSGDMNGFTKIHDRYRTPLVVFVNSMVKDQDLAQDIVQDIFMDLFRRAKEILLVSQDHLANYLYKSVRYKVFNAIRKEQTRINYLESIANFTFEAGNSADEVYNLKELTKIIEDTIEHMQPRMKEIYNLSRKQHLSHKEIADFLNLSENTVSNQIYRAVKILKKNKEISACILIMSFSVCSQSDIYNLAYLIVKYTISLGNIILDSFITSISILLHFVGMI